MRAATLLILTIVILGFTACSKPVSTPTPSPTPSPTPTPTFEQKRTAVLRYLQAFNGIDNSLDDTMSQIEFPRSATTARDLLAYNQAIGLYLAALNGASARLTELQPSNLDPETSSHLNQVKNLVLVQQQDLEALRQAIAAGEQARMSDAFAKLEAAGTQGSAINRATEQLLLKYNIPDTEVSYRYRGQ